MASLCVFKHEGIGCDRVRTVGNWCDAHHPRGLAWARKKVKAYRRLTGASARYRDACTTLGKSLTRADLRALKEKYPVEVNEIRLANDALRRASKAVGDLNEL